jgi:hypothetical protein
VKKVGEEIQMYTFINKKIILCFMTIALVCKADDTVNIYKERIVTLDGNPEDFVVSINIRSLSIGSPFFWDVVVKNKSTILFKLVQDDTDLNSNFDSNQYVGNCKGHIECKQKWYLKELPKSVLEALTYVDGEMPEDWQQSNLEENATKFLEQSGFSESEMIEVLKEMKANLQSGFISFSIPVSPVEESPSFMYVKSINRFVPYWND